MLVNINESYQVEKKDLLSKCQWSPFEGDILYGKVNYTIVNGNIVYKNGSFDETNKGMRLVFER